MKDKLKKIQRIGGDAVLKTKLRLAVWSFIFAIAFGGAGIIMIPMGVIDTSVLLLIAQLLILCGTLLGGSFTFDLEHKYFHADVDEKEKDDAEKNEDK